MSATVEHLFAYGTLRRSADGAPHPLLDGAVDHAGAAWVHGRLYDVGPYPALVEAAEAADRVHGELYHLRAPAAAALIGRLDAYEGHLPRAPERSLFRRVVAGVGRDGGPVVPAWVYLYNRPVDSRRRIASGLWVTR